MLAAELELRVPHLTRELNCRASDWCDANGMPDAAIAYADAGNDPTRIARLVSDLALALHRRGRIGRVGVCFDRFDDDRLAERDPAVLALGAWSHTLAGRSLEADRWTDAAALALSRGALPERNDVVAPWIAVLRAIACRDGIDRMRSDAEALLTQLPPEGRWRSVALLALGMAHLLGGDDEAADSRLADAADAEALLGPTDFGAVALAERALLALARGDHRRSEALAQQARATISEGGLEDDGPSAIAYAVAARISLKHGDWARAQADLEHARGLLPKLTTPFPGSPSRLVSSSPGPSSRCSTRKERASSWWRPKRCCAAGPSSASSSSRLRRRNGMSARSRDRAPAASPA